MKTLILTSIDGTIRPLVIADSAVVVPIEPPPAPPPFDEDAAGIPYRTEFTFKTTTDAERGVRYKSRTHICMVDGVPMRVTPDGSGRYASCSEASADAFERAVAAFVAERRDEWKAARNKSTARAAIRIAGSAANHMFLELDVRETPEEIGRMLTSTPTASPTEADIARRVALVHEACVVGHEAASLDSGYMGVARQIDSSGATTRYLKRVGEKWATQHETHYEQAIRAIAIKGLLSERGAR